MKERINKTIITKRGGTIVIPNKIISKEYPSNGGDSPTPVPPSPIQEPDLYMIDVYQVVTDTYKISVDNKFLVAEGQNDVLNSGVNTIGQTDKFSLTFITPTEEGSTTIESYKCTTIEPGANWKDNYIIPGSKLVFVTPFKDTALYILSCLGARVGQELEINFSLD